MNKNIDIEAAQEVASDLSGALQHLSSLHAALAASDKYGRHNAGIAATLSMLHAQAERLSDMLMQ